jgi:hypothetical protein
MAPTGLEPVTPGLKNAYRVTAARILKNLDCFNLDCFNLDFFNLDFFWSTPLVILTLTLIQAFH